MYSISKVINIYSPPPRVKYRHKTLVPTCVRSHAAHVLVYHILRILPVGVEIIQQRPIALPPSADKRKIAEMTLQPRAKVAERYRIIVTALQNHPYHAPARNHIQRSVQCRALELHKPVRETPMLALVIDAQVENTHPRLNLLRQ